MHSILRQQEAQFVAVGGCGCRLPFYTYYNTFRLKLTGVSCYLYLPGSTLLVSLRYLP